MSEKITTTQNEVPRSVQATISQFEANLLEAGEPINDAEATVTTAQQAVDGLNFKSDATDHIYAKAGLRTARENFEQVKTEFEPQLTALNETWTRNGGARIDAARNAVADLNFKSDALDHVKAKKELQAAEDAWAMSYEAENAARLKKTEYQSLDDIVLVGNSGNTFHRADGKLLTKHELEQISTHKDQIREGLADRRKPVVDEGSNDEQGTQPHQSDADFVKGFIDGANGPTKSVDIDMSIEVPAAQDGIEEPDDYLDTSGLRDALDDDNEDEHVTEKIKWYQFKKRHQAARTLFGIRQSEDSKGFTRGVSSYVGGFIFANRKPSETQEQYEDRTRRNGRTVLIGVAAVGAVAAVWGIYNGISTQETGVSSSAGTTEVGTVDSSTATPDVVAAVTDPNAFLGNYNFTVLDGAGGESLMQSLGHQPAEWYPIQSELLQNFPNNFYDMGGNVGISQPGDLPLEVKQFIASRLGLS